MPPGKKPVSCIPCAQRKVRCDRLQPCCHCKRRRQDACVYPDSREFGNQLLRERTDRIEQLEQYVRNLGGDPNHADEIRRPSGSDPRTPQNPTNSFRQSPTGLTPTLRSLDGEVRRAFPGESELLAHGGGVSYIETPMWYSWRGNEHPSNPHHQSNHPSDTHNVPTILNRRIPVHCDDSFRPSPSSLHLGVLWTIFLRNVHPLVKIFFDWEVAPLMEKTQKNASELSIEEHALVNGIRFIATLTLSEEESHKFLSGSKQELLDDYQKSSEHALTMANYAETTDKRVLQALMLYILAMRDRTRPSSVHPLLGIASRVAERMGLQRDGSTFNLSLLRSEERRRIWWQLQFLELSVARLVGTLGLTIFATWDTRIPSNIEDDDLDATMEVMPSERKGLTSISPCLWRYSILQRRREILGRNHSGDLSWMLSPHLSVEERDEKIEELEGILSERFLRHCELVNPLHVYMQIGIRLFGLAARSNVRQPTLVNAKISELQPQVREDLLEISSKCLEYFVLSQTIPSISGFRWGNDLFFQVPSFVYVILEAHQRSSEPQSADLWNLIGRVYEAHPDLMTAVNRPEVKFLARITVAAWQKYASEGLHPQSDVPTTPEWLQKICHNFQLPVNAAFASSEEALQSPNASSTQLLPIDFDFDMIDWSAWEALG